MTYQPRHKRSRSTSSNGDRHFVTALARGLEILRCFSVFRSELGMPDIVRMTKLPQPTVWRLCHTLTEMGFLLSAPGRDKLRLGIPVLGLGYTVLASHPISALARPYLQRIANSHQGAVSLAARDGFNMIYVQRCQGPSIVMDLPVGSRVPIAYSSSGWAYIAGLHPDKRKTLLLEIRKAYPKTRKILDHYLPAALQTYDDTGYVMNIGVANNQINAVAVPVQSQDGTTLFALSTGGMSSIFDHAKLKVIGEDLKALALLLAPII